MEANIIKVGNSKGIIIPSKFLKLIGIKNKVNIEVEDDRLVIAPSTGKAREGWEEIIANEVSKNGQPETLVPNLFEDQDLKEWTW